MKDAMRLWSVHPKYLDVKGLVALWREALLAQCVLQGNTKGYKNHPQLARFKESRNPEGAIAVYLRCVADEAEERGYKFNREKIANKRLNSKISVTRGQIEYEFDHLMRKLANRDPGKFRQLKNITRPHLHPLFNSIKGDVEDWEVV